MAKSEKEQRVVYISNLVKTAASASAFMDDLVKKNPGYSQAGTLDAAGASLSSWLQQQAAAVDSILQGQHSSAEHLPLPSRRAYLWLKSLAEPGRLLQHLAGLCAAYRIAAAPAFQQKMRLAARFRPLRISFINQPYLFRTRSSLQEVELAIHEGFCSAPDEVLEDILGAALLRKLSTRIERIRRYAASEPFLKISAFLDGGKKKKTHAPRGQTYNLDQVFHQVNEEYFQGQLEKPTLVWSRVPTYRTFGHFHVELDTVTVSRTLDSASVPSYVVEYIMYHELLHKKVGIKTSGKRKLAHTAEFRRQEQAFKRYQEAKMFLQKLAGKSPRRRLK
jgi:hypothetical protein